MLMFLNNRQQVRHFFVDYYLFYKHLIKMDHYIKETVYKSKSLSHDVDEDATKCFFF